MKYIRYHLKLCATAACTKKLMEETSELGTRDLKGSTRDFFLFGSWFLLKKSAVEAAFIGVDLIGMEKINTKRFFKATIEQFKKYCSGGS